MVRFIEPIADKESSNPLKLDLRITPRKQVADTSSSIRAKGASDLFGKGVQIADLAIKEKVLFDEREIADTFYDTTPVTAGDPEFDTNVTGRAGFDAEDETGRVVEGFVQPVPEAVTSTFNRMERLQSGVAQGRLSETARMDKLDKDLKALRSRFPGHRDFIDGEARRITGLPSANTLRNQRLAISRASTTLADKQRTRRLETEQEAMSLGLTSTQAGALTDRQLNVHIALQKRLDHQQKQHTFNTAVKAGTIKEKATSAQQMQQHNVKAWQDKIALQSGIPNVTNWGDLQSMANRFIETILNPRAPQPSDDDKLAFNTQMNRAKESLIVLVTDDVLRQPIITNPDGTTRKGKSDFDLIKEQRPDITVAQLVKELTEHVTAQIDAVVDANPTVMKAATERDKRVQDSAVSKLRNGRPDLASIPVLEKVAGKAYTEAWLSIQRDVVIGKSEGALTQAQTILEEATSRRANFVKSMFDTVTQGKGVGIAKPGRTNATEGHAANEQSGGTENDKIERFRVWEDMAMKAMLDPTAPASTRLEVMKYFYNANDAGSFLKRVKSDQQLRVYNRRYNAITAKAVRDSGNAALIQQYQQAAESDMLTMKAHSGAANLLRETDIKITVRPDGLLEFVPTGADGFDLTSDIPEGAINKVDAALRDFNGMALRYQAAMEELHADVLALDESGGNEPNQFIKDFYRKVVPMPDFTPEAKSVTATIIKSIDVGSIEGGQATSNVDLSTVNTLDTGFTRENTLGRGSGTPADLTSPDPASAPPPPGPALSNLGGNILGTPEDDGGQTATVPASASLTGVSDAQGLPDDRLAGTLALPDDEIEDIVVKVFGEDTGVSDDSVTNSRIFRSLLKGDGKVPFPDTGNQGGLRAFFTELDVFLSDPVSALTGRERQALIEWRTTVRGPAPEGGLPERRPDPAPVDIPLRKPVTIARTGPGVSEGAKVQVDEVVTPEPKENKTVTDKFTPELNTSLKTANVRVPEDMVQAITNSTMSDPTEIKNFIAQMQTETGFRLVSENLNYKAKRLMQISRTARRKGKRAVDAAIAAGPEAIGNLMYDGRMGNGVGEGYKYRGRGYIQITGKNNYREIGQLIGEDLVGNPDLLLDPAVAAKATIAWWQKNIPGKIAKGSDVRAVRLRVNGGTNGLAEARRISKALGI